MRKVKNKIVSVVLAFAIVSTSVSVGSTVNAVDAQAKAKASYVYIAASGNGQCYHSSKNCSRMRGRVVKITVSKAKAKGYRACKKCY